MNSYKIIWVDTDHETHREVVKARKAGFACIEVEQRPDCREVLGCLSTTRNLNSNQPG